MASICRDRQKGLSLLEVLTTIAVIFILVSLLGSSIYSSREKSKMAICINNLKNLTASVLLSANDNDQFPGAIAKSYFSPHVSPGMGLAYADVSNYYDNQTGITQCPKVTGSVHDSPSVYSYGINQVVRGVNLHRIRKSSRIIVVGESNNMPVIGKAEEVSFRHFKRAFAGFADGHVELIRFEQLIDAPEDIFGSPMSQGASGNGVLLDPESIPSEVPADDGGEDITIEIPFGFSETSICSNGFRWDFNGLTDNGDGTKTFSFTITNFNNKALSNAAFGLPDDVSAEYPPDGGIYAGENNNYQVENTTEDPFHSIKFNAIGEGIKNGGAESFLFTLTDANVGMVIKMKVRSKGGRYVGEGEFATDGSGSGSCS